MTNRDAAITPQVYARIGGVLYLVIIVAGLFGEMVVRNSLVVSGDAAATANNIMGSEWLWRLGIAGDLIMHVCDVPLMMILYLLLRPVDRNLALLALLFTFVQSAAMVATKLNLFAPLSLLGNAAYLKAFEPAQLQAMAYLSIKADSYGFGVGLIFFGFACIVMGYLIFRSGYFPRMIGVLMQLTGLAYLINSFALILAPPLAKTLFPAILLPAFVGELSFCLWLIFKGVNVTRWNERVGAA
jgi:hypothetical protein